MVICRGIGSNRGGYSFAEGAHLHGKPPERHRVKELRRAWIWGMLIPFAAILSLCLYGPWALIILAIYPLQIVRLTIEGDRSLKINFLRAFFLILGKYPEMVGGIQFLLNRIFKKTTKIIEYK